MDLIIVAMPWYERWAPWAGNLADWAQAAVLIGTAILIYRQIREAQRLRREETRPYVIVRMSTEGGALARIEIANVGRTMARDVVVTLDKKSSRATTLSDDFGEIIERSRPSLAPGETLIFDLEYLLSDNLPNPWPRYGGTVSYSDHQHRTLPEETWVIDLEAYRNSIVEPPSVERTLNKIEDHLKKLPAEFARLRPNERRDREGRRRAFVHEVSATYGNEGLRGLYRVLARRFGRRTGLGSFR